MVILKHEGPAPQEGKYDSIVSVFVKVAMMRGSRHRSLSWVITHLWVLVTLLLQAASSVHGLPLHNRDTSKLCGANLRPSGVRNLCVNAGKIWHFDAEDDFKKMELDKEKFLPSNLQCGKSTRTRTLDLPE